MNSFRRRSEDATVNAALRWLSGVMATLAASGVSWAVWTLIELREQMAVMTYWLRWKGISP